MVTIDRHVPPFISLFSFDYKKYVLKDGYSRFYSYHSFINIFVDLLNYNFGKYNVIEDYSQKWKKNCYQVNKENCKKDCKSIIEIFPKKNF